MNRMTVYDPFADVFPHFFRGLTTPVNGQSAVSRFPVDVTEGAQAYTVQADIPGVVKDDINVEIDGNRVSISVQTEKSADQANDESRTLRIERKRGSMSRSFALESEIDESAASASYDNGVLTLTLPKKVVAGAKRLAIN